MKSRSQHPLPITSDTPNNWGDGSWKVDCVCGVTFDDGQQMVACDECGVWVHTRCSGFVKGSFACDECKKKKAPGDNSNETEVAELLVQLPTKPIRVDRLPAGPPHPQPIRKRLWTQIPMEERVHVHGIPGGDPALFQELSSSVFNRELWKSTGFVPKKFNFQYKEFPWWDDGDKDAEKQKVDTERDGEEKENAVDRGANVLFSLSKEVGTIGGLRGYDSGGGGERKSPTKEMQKRDWGKGGLSSGHMETCANWDGIQLGPVGLPLGKSKREDLEVSKEESRKKSRNAVKDVDNKKTGDSAPATDAHKLDILEHGDFKVGNSTDYQDTKSEYEWEAENNYRSHLEAPVRSSEPEPILLTEAPAEIFRDCAFQHKFSPEPLVKVENINNQAAIRNGISPHADAPETSLRETKGIGKVPTKEEDVRSAVDGLNLLRDESHNMMDLNEDSSSVAVDSKKSKLVDGDQRNTAQDARDICIPPDSNGAVSLSFVQTNARSKMEADDGHTKVDSVLLHFVDGRPVLVSNSLQHFAQSDEETSKNLQVHGMPAGNLQSGEHSAHDAESLNCDDTIAEGTISMVDEPHHCEQESAGPLMVQEGCLKPRKAAKCIEEPLKLETTNRSPPAPSLCKLAVGIGKSTSSTLVFSNSSVSGNYKSMRTTTSQAAMRLTHPSKNRVKIKSSTDHKKDNVAINVQWDESKQNLRAPVKDRAKSPANCGLKQPHASRTSHSSISKHSFPDVKVQQVPWSTKGSITQNVAKFSDAVDCSSLSQMQITSQSKLSSSSNQKSEKINQSSSQSSSKVSNHSPSVHPLPPAPVNMSAALSDEELALLLHQELNSSTRVPRVPRIRHTGILPQLSSPTATSMLAKCTYSSGGKDHISVSKVKNREEVYKDNSCSSRELVDESKSYADQEKDSVFAADCLIKRVSSTPDAIASTKKSMPLMSSTLSGHTSSMEPNDQTMSSVRCSPRNEWAQLIDRGPKTISSRKMRECDAKGRPLKQIEGKIAGPIREELPEGKCGTRKRRRLQLQGRFLKEVKQQQKMDAATGEDFGTNLSEGSESIFGEDENLGERTGKDENI